MLGTLGLIGIVVLLVIYGARYTGTDNPDGAPAKPLPSFCCCGVNRVDGPVPRELREEITEVEPVDEDSQL